MRRQEERQGGVRRAGKGSPKSKGQSPKDEQGQSEFEV